MKKLLVSIVLGTLAAGAFTASAQNRVTQQPPQPRDVRTTTVDRMYSVDPVYENFEVNYSDRWDTDRMKVYDRYGREAGYREVDRTNRDRTNIYDSRGNRTGYHEVDSRNRNRVNVYNANGTKMGYYKRNSTNPAKWDYHRE